MFNRVSGSEHQDLAAVLAEVGRMDIPRLA